MTGTYDPFSPKRRGSITSLILKACTNTLPRRRWKFSYSSPPSTALAASYASSFNTVEVSLSQSTITQQ